MNWSLLSNLDSFKGYFFFPGCNPRKQNNFFWSIGCQRRCYHSGLCNKQTEKHPSRKSLLRQERKISPPPLNAISLCSFLPPAQEGRRRRKGPTLMAILCDCNPSIRVVRHSPKSRIKKKRSSSLHAWTVFLSSFLSQFIAEADSHREERERETVHRTSEPCCCPLLPSSPFQTDKRRT